MDRNFTLSSPGQDLPCSVQPLPQFFWSPRHRPATGSQCWCWSSGGLPRPLHVSRVHHLLLESGLDGALDQWQRLLRARDCSKKGPWYPGFQTSPLTCRPLIPAQMEPYPSPLQELGWGSPGFSPCPLFFPTSFSHPLSNQARSIKEQGLAAELGETNSPEGRRGLERRGRQGM